MPKKMSIRPALLAAVLLGMPAGATTFAPGNGARTGVPSYNMIDYDTFQSEREIRDSEIRNSIEKWSLGIKNTYWENYRGNNVRVEVLRNNRDLKEMRLKFVQSPHMVSNPDAPISEALDNVAGKVMRGTCGRRAKQAIILYERPSVELVKETTYDYYKIIARGSSLKEYGFRCIY